MVRNLWQQIFLRFLQKIRLTQHFLKALSLDELPQSSYVQQLGEQISQKLKLNALKDTDEIFVDLKAHPKGLYENEVDSRLQEYGINELNSEKPVRWWQQLWCCYNNPFNIILTILAVLTALTDDKKRYTYYFYYGGFINVAAFLAGNKIK